MSSVQSSYAAIAKPPTKFASLLTPSYDDDTIVSGETISMPIPFRVVNQVLDINVNQSSDIQAFVNNGTNPTHESDPQAKSFGGASLVKSFGPNMITYLRNWINGIETLGAAYTGPLVLYIQPFMVKVQVANPKFAIQDITGAFNDSRTWGVNTEAPVSTEYTGGGTNDNFFTCWIFKTPMTIQYETAGGAYKYITMTSQFAED
jgi:hypothetical protein